MAAKKNILITDCTFYLDKQIFPQPAGYSLSNETSICSYWLSAILIISLRLFYLNLAYESLRTVQNPGFKAT